MWSHIKDILQKENGKCIIIEDGKPSYVVLPFEDYLKLKESRGKACANIVMEKDEDSIVYPVRKSDNLEFVHSKNKEADLKYSTSEIGGLSNGAETVNQELSAIMPDTPSFETVLSKQPEIQNNKIRLEDLPF